MADIEKMNVVKSIVAKSGIDYNIDLYSDKKNKNVLSHWGNLLGTNRFFVFGDKVALRGEECIRKELYVIVDERYSFLQLTTYQKNGEVIDGIKTDEIVRFKKFNSNVCVEKAKLVQKSDGSSKMLKVNSIEEIVKINGGTLDSVVERSAFSVSDDFVFVGGFIEDDKEDTNVKTSSELRVNMIDKYIRFNTNNYNEV